MDDTLYVDRLLNRREVAAIFGISVRFLEISGPRGDGPPAVKIGRMVRYRVGDMRDWIAAHVDDAPDPVAKEHVQEAVNRQAFISCRIHRTLGRWTLCQSFAVADDGEPGILSAHIG